MKDSIKIIGEIVGKFLDAINPIRLMMKVPEAMRKCDELACTPCKWICYIFVLVAAMFGFVMIMVTFILFCALLFSMGIIPIDFLTTLKTVWNIITL